MGTNALQTYKAGHGREIFYLTRNILNKGHRPLVCDLTCEFVDQSPPDWSQYAEDAGDGGGLRGALGHESHEEGLEAVGGHFEVGARLQQQAAV